MHKIQSATDELNTFNRFPNVHIKNLPVDIIPNNCACVYYMCLLVTTNGLRSTSMIRLIRKQLTWWKPEQRKFVKCMFTYVHFCPTNFIWSHVNTASCHQILVSAVGIARPADLPIHVKNRRSSLSCSRPDKERTCLTVELTQFTPPHQTRQNSPVWRGGVN